MDALLHYLDTATTTELIEIERSGIPSEVIRELAARLNVPLALVFRTLGVNVVNGGQIPRRKIFDGNVGYAAIALANLMSQAQKIIEGSTSSDAVDFNAGYWLGEWLQTPQPALGGRSAADLMDTPTGQNAISRLLGSLVSGAYH